MKKRVQMQTFAWVGGGTLPFALSVLPPKHLCRQILLHCHLTGTKGSSETVAVADFARAIQNIRLANFGGNINLSGYDLDQLFLHHYGRVVEQRVAVPGTGTTFTIDMDLVIPFRDNVAISPDDTSMPTELIHDRTLEVTMAPGAVFGGTIVITAGTIWADAALVGSSSIRSPEFRELQMKDPGGLTCPLEAGYYIDLFMVNEDGSNITAANVTQVNSVIDGQSIIDNLTPDQLISDWNAEKAVDVVTSGLLPLPARCLPILWGESANNEVTKYPVATLPGAKAQLNGTIAAPHYVYWRSMLKTEEMVAESGRKQGLVEPKAEYYEARPAGGSLESAPDSANARKKTSVLMGKFVHPNQLARRAAKPAFERK